MNKEVMISIQSYFVFLIIAKYMGWNIPQDKKVEVRKDFPKNKCWNKKSHIYCSKSKKSFKRIPKKYQPFMRPLLGKVIGEFVCDKVGNILYDDRDGNNMPLEEVLKKSCLKYKELCKYGNSKDLYAWHISQLKIYDKPKELSEFRIIKQCNGYKKNDRKKPCYNCCEEGVCMNGVLRKPLTRPPQSWCYVEELAI